MTRPDHADTPKPWEARALAEADTNDGIDAWAMVVGAFALGLLIGGGAMLAMVVGAV